MASMKRLKRRMVRQAIRDNLDLLHGTRRRRRSRVGHLLLVSARTLFLVSLPAALFTSTLVLSNLAAEWRESPPVDTARAPSAIPGRALSRPDESGAWEPGARELAVPKPIDPAVLPLALRTVVLDPGHGGENEGTIAPIGLVEKEITLDIAFRLRELLEERSYRVVMTRENDLALSLRERAELANQRRGDIFVSIHVNWIENREIRGVETFYLGPTDDPYLEALAARENQQSGYSLADLRDILQQVYAGVRQEESRRLAGALQRSLFEALHEVNNDVRDRGVKSAPFGVLTRTEMPAALAEVSCVSNEVEARLLMTPIYRQYLAEAIVRGIEAYSRGLGQAWELDG